MARLTVVTVHAPPTIQELVSLRTSFNIPFLDTYPLFLCLNHPDLASKLNSSNQNIYKQNYILIRSFVETVHSSTTVYKLF